MAQLTRAQLRSTIAAMLDYPDDAGTDYRTNLDRWLDIGQRYVWEQHPWYERVATYVLSTIAPYVTGTVDFTLGSTGITGTGTTWTAGMNGRKITTAYGNPWYVFTRTGAGTGTLAQAYAEASVTGSGYSIFCDEYDLPTDCEVVVDVSCFSSFYAGILRAMTGADLDAAAFVHGAVGTPLIYCMTPPTTAGVRRIRLYPIPDNVYRIRFTYLKACTDFADDAAVSVLDVRKERALILAACLEAQRAGDARMVTSQGDVDGAVLDAWRQEAQQQPISVRRGGLRGRRGWTLWGSNQLGST